MENIIAEADVDRDPDRNLEEEGQWAVEMYQNCQEAKAVYLNPHKLRLPTKKMLKTAF